MLFFTYWGSRVVVLHRLAVKRPHIFFPGKSLFFSSITTDSCVIDSKVTLDSFIDERTLQAHKVLLFASNRYGQIKQLGRNLPSEETKDWRFLSLHTDQVLFCVGIPVDLLLLLRQMLVLTFSKLMGSFELLKRNFVLLMWGMMFLLL